MVEDVVDDALPSVAIPTKPIAPTKPKNRSALPTSRALIALLVLPTLVALLMTPLPRPLSSTSFNNPIMGQGQDPSVVNWKGNYYLVQSDGAQLIMYISHSLTEIAHGEREIVLGAGCCQLWAPELIALNGKWYIYYSASTGDNASHRMYTLESAGSSPAGPYHAKGKIAAQTDAWAIDGTVLRVGAAMYFIWSGWPGTNDGQQNLYIAAMSNPWTIRGERHLLSAPTSAWEQSPGSYHVNLEEGPEILQHGGNTFLVYSTHGSWSDDYCLGMLTYKGGDVMSGGSWMKSHGCVFAKNPKEGIYGPGHNSFTTSPDGRENWIVYHADDVSGAGWAGRSIHAQRFTWDANGTPDFGVPVANSVALDLPSGEAPPSVLRWGWCFC